MKKASILFFCICCFSTFLFAQPSSVTIISPQDSSSGLFNSVKFVWSTSPTALAYTIQLSTSINFNSLTVNQSIADTSFSVSTLLASTIYYCRVRAENLGGASTWTTTTIATKLNIPSLESPAAGSLNVNLKPTFGWSTLGSATKYTIQLSISPDFSVITRSAETAIMLLSLDSLTRATKYYWRVRAYFKNDTTEYSIPRNFSTILTYPHMMRQRLV